jgi:ABC-type transport system involved in multi-copper enzyme maturation permease subunit
MASRAIRPKRDDDSVRGGADWKGLADRAPSIVRPDEPTTARWIALVGVFPLTLGVAALFFGLVLQKGYLISPSLGVVLLVIGVGALLYHAFVEKDLQYRRLYGAVGGLCLALGVLFRLLPYDGALGGLFLPYGTPCMLLALGFLASFVRNETDPAVRHLTLTLLGLVGLGCAALGFVGGAFSDTFMLGQGVVLLTLGLLYLGSYVVMQGSESDRGYYAGLGIGAFGALMIAVCLVATFGPSFWEGRGGGTFFMPRGLLLLYFGLEYLLLSVGICSDNRFVVMTRRELAAFFYSPIAYVVLIGIALLGWLCFNQFLHGLLVRQNGTTLEPVSFHFTTNWFQIFSVVLVVPLLTMRLLSEERRTGSLEVLLTAPVNETSVVMSKFFAALRIFLLAWYSWGVFMVALRIEGGQEFDYRPLLTFMLALLFMGAGWLAMGLFFSSLTRNQIAAAIITVVAMIALTLLFFLKPTDENSTWHGILTYVSFVDLWINSSLGQISPRHLLFHLSFAVFFLFLTVKVLEARKWA